MNDQPKSIWRREILPDAAILKWPRRFFRWLVSWRVLRRTLIVLAWTATIIALFYGEENWRGRRAWNKYRHELEARGEPLDLAAFIPKPVPDEQNFAMTPLLAPLFDFDPGTQHWRDTNAVARVQQPPPRYEKVSRKIKSTQDGDWARGLTIHLGPWALAYDPDLTNKPAKL